MASSIVHLAITNELTKKNVFKDPVRLKFGAVVVDAGVGGNQFGNTHMKVFVEEGKKKTYDLDRYREMFGERMLTDVYGLLSASGAGFSVQALCL